MCSTFSRCRKTHLIIKETQYDFVGQEAHTLDSLPMMKPHLKLYYCNLTHVFQSFKLSITGIEQAIIMSYAHTSCISERIARL